MQDTDTHVTVVLVTAGHEKNEDVRIPLLIETVKCMAEDPGVPYELIVVVNRTTPRHSEVVHRLEDEHPEIRHVVWNKFNLGMTGAFRTGFSIAEGKYIVNVVDDVWLGPGWLAELLYPFEHIDMEAFRSNTDVIDRARTTGFITALSTGFSIGKLISNIEIADRPYRIVTRAGVHCWGWRREDYEKVGPFPAQQDGDTKMANRIEQKGFCWIIPPKERVDQYYRDMDAGREGDVWDFENKKLTSDRRNKRIRPWKYSEKRLLSDLSWKETLNYWKNKEFTVDQE